MVDADTMANSRSHVSRDSATNALAGDLSPSGNEADALTSSFGSMNIGATSFSPQNPSRAYQTPYGGTTDETRRFRGGIGPDSATRGGTNGADAFKVYDYTRGPQKPTGAYNTASENTKPVASARPVALASSVHANGPNFAHAQFPTDTSGARKSSAPKESNVNPLSPSALSHGNFNANGSNGQNLRGMPTPMAASSPYLTAPPMNGNALPFNSQVTHPYNMQTFYETYPYLGQGQSMAPLQMMFNMQNYGIPLGQEATQNGAAPALGSNGPVNVPDPRIFNGGPSTGAGELPQHHPQATYGVTSAGQVVNLATVGHVDLSSQQNRAALGSVIPDPQANHNAMMTGVTTMYTADGSVNGFTGFVNGIRYITGIPQPNPDGTGPSTKNRKLGLYKTELCRSWEEKRTCRYQLKCQFAHGHEEMRKVARHPKFKTEICRTFLRDGTCPYGKRCCFIHTQAYENSVSQPSITYTPDNSSGLYSSTEEVKAPSVRIEGVSHAAEPIMGRHSRGPSDSSTSGASMLARINANKERETVEGSTRSSPVPARESEVAPGSTGTRFTRGHGQSASIHFGGSSNSARNLSGGLGADLAGASNGSLTPGGTWGLNSQHRRSASGSSVNTHTPTPWNNPSAQEEHPFPSYGGI